MQITRIKGIGEATVKELNRVGLYTLEDIDKCNKIKLTTDTNIPAGKLLKIMNFFKVQGATIEAIESIRKNHEEKQNIMKNDKFIGMELYDIRDKKGKIVDYHPSQKMYQYDFETIDGFKSNTLYTKEQLQELISDQDDFKKRYFDTINKNKNEQLKEEQAQKVQEKLNKKDREVYLIDDFTANMTPLKRGKIIKQLDNIFRYNGAIYSYKQWIYDMIMNKNAETEIDMRKYATKKVNGYYKELDKPKKEYYVMADGSGMQVNKMQYEYAEFLKSRR